MGRARSRGREVRFDARAYVGFSSYFRTVRIFGRKFTVADGTFVLFSNLRLWSRSWCGGIRIRLGTVTRLARNRSHGSMMAVMAVRGVVL